METDFIDWLIEEMNEREWSNSDLARKAGIVPSTVSLILSGKSKPGYRFCVMIAKAFDETPEQILRRAGLLDQLPGPEDSLTLRELMEIAKSLDDEDIHRLMGIARLWVRERYKRERERDRLEYEEKKREREARSKSKRGRLASSAT